MSDEDEHNWLIAGKYELVAPLGEGGMASVWRGLTVGASGFTRPVAIKRVLPALAKDPHFAAMFIEEARVSADLHHPNVVQVHDFERDREGNYFIVMEWVEGVDLNRWIKSHLSVGERPPWHLVTAIAIEVLRALTAAHDRRNDEGQLSPVIHRDVTPSNILIGKNGIVKLADFGMARAMDRTSMTKPGTVKGKLSYMAPEILFGHKATERSDIYGLGIVMWESLTARRLFSGGSDVDVVMRVRKGEVPSLSAERPDLPQPLAEVVHCALAREPHERFETAREMLRALASILRTHPEATDAGPLGESVRTALRRLEPSAR